MAAGMLRHVLLAARYIFDLCAGPRSRAREVYEARRRLLAQDWLAAGLGGDSDEEVGLAGRLRELREAFIARLGDVDACARCIVAPADGWTGGACCSGGATRDFFSDAELAALRLSGTRPADLKPAGGPHRGCAFRGRSGCTLTAAHRPCVCVGYACRELLLEVHRRGHGPAIARLQDELHKTFQAFAAQREARLQDRLFEDLRRGLLGAG